MKRIETEEIEKPVINRYATILPRFNILVSCTNIVNQVIINWGIVINIINRPE